MTEAGPPRRDAEPGDEPFADDEPFGRVEGMGSHPSGPAFLPSTGEPPSMDATSTSNPPAASANHYRPPRRRLPAAITALVIGFVAVVVAAATLVAVRDDSRPVATQVATPKPSVSPRTDRIEFGTAFGDGVLVVASHSWVPAPSSVHGELLRIRVRLTCLAGQIDVSPDNFQAFDANGQLFEISEDDSAQALADTTIAAGETVGGTITFDLPHGEVTLIMNDGSQSVTALKIPD